ncbi:MAG TPA: hypothetical protein VFC59_07625, partial [Cryobacterium sp.]|nr:hypothetical protein [Cryobacterium sp.]
YVERGGRTMLAFGPGPGFGPGPASDAEADDILRAAAVSLSGVVTAGRVEKLAVQTVNGVFVVGTGVGAALQAAGFGLTPQGLRLRA